MINCILQGCQMKNVSKKIKIFLLHVSVWSFFLLVIILQTPYILGDNSWWELIVFFSFAILLSYINVYLFFPKFFLKRKYVEFWLALVVATAIISFLNTSLFINFNEDYYLSSFLANFLNLLLIALTLAGLKYISEDLPKIVRFNELTNQQLKTELSLLKAQVNPHFLFNTLNNLYGLILQNQNQQASEITLKLSELMRYILESSKIDKVNLKKEIQFLEVYLVLEKVRLSPKANISFEVYGLEKDVFVAPLLFIPVVENAFKHGLQIISESSFAHFSLSIQGDDIFFEAQNSVGIKSKNEKSGIGLENLRKRLELMYPEKHHLEIEQNEEIFKVILLISI